MTTLKPWQKPIAWTIILLAFLFVLAWRVYVTARWRVWAGRIFLNGKGANHGLRR